MPMFRKGGTEMKKVVFFMVVCADIVWLTLGLVFKYSLFWLVAFCVVQALVGGPYFASKIFIFLASFLGKSDATSDK